MNDQPKHRPDNCRNALQGRGEPYPRSGCAVCGNGGLAGCPYDQHGLADALALAEVRIKQLEAERDALAAHLERLRREWEKRDAHEMSYREKLDALMNILYSETPTSLARLRAEWQAEELSAMIAAIPFSESLARDMLKHRRDELRQQAEGGES